MPQTNALFSAQDLTDWLHKTVDDAAAAVAERVVWGWLKPILDLDERPAPASDELVARAIELGGIAHENPAGKTRKEIGPFLEMFSAERRTEILEEVAAGFMPLGTPAKPSGSFPPACPYPDPARRFDRWIPSL